MSTISRTLSISINPVRLLEDLAATLPATLLDPIGFVRETDRKYNLRAGPFVYEKTLAGESTAQPGDIRLEFSRELTAQEIVDMDAILVAHDHTVLTARQIQLDADLVIIADLKTTIAGGGTLTLAQLTEFTRIALDREAG